VDGTITELTKLLPSLLFIFVFATSICISLQQNFQFSNQTVKPNPMVSTTQEIYIETIIKLQW